MLILKLLILLTLANGAPVIAKRLCGQRYTWPLDGGINFIDGKRLFGSSKTLRGLISAVLLTTLGGLLLDFGWMAGAIIGMTAMLGDLFSSFCKRRMNMPSSSMALGLDQVPESLFPLLAVQHLLQLTLVDIVLVVSIFFIAELLGSRLLFKLHIRDRPY